MKSTYIKPLSHLFIAVALFTGCSEDNHIGDEIFNDETRYPYVFIQDRNEDMEDIGGNNFWNFILTAENDGSQVRVDYGSQDPTIVKHDIIVGFDGNTSPPEDGVVLRTLTQFPTEEIITKQHLADALGVPVENLDTGTVFFGGRSENEAGQVVENPDDFEPFIAAERHAYFYRWPLNQ